MANHFSATGTIDVTAAVDLLNKAIDVVYMRRNEIVDDGLAPFFDKETKDSGLSHIISSVGGSLPLPQINSDTEALPYFTPDPGFDKTFTLLRLRSGIRVTRTMLKADRFAKVMQMTTGQMKSGLLYDAYMRASVINGAFAGTTGADAKYLCDDDHPHENGEAGTWDNLGTGALSGPNLHALRLLTQKMTNEQGFPMDLTPKVLLVPVDIEQKALELTTAMRKPEGMLNEDNVLIKGLQVKTCRYLTDTDAYFLFCDLTGYERGLVEVVLEDWNVMDNSPANADIVVDKRLAATKAFGFTITKNCFGSAGA